MTQQGYDHEELQLLWLIGTLERLSTLGYINNVPYTVTPENVELFNSINPSAIFDSDEEIKSLLSVLIQVETPKELLPGIEDTIQGVLELVLQYKKDPYHLAKKGLEKLV